MELKDSQSYAAAEAALQKSIQLAPNYQAYANLGLLHIEQKRYTEAAAAMRKAVELNDKDWRVWSGLQLAYTWLKDDEKMRGARAKTLSLLEQYASLNSQEAPVQSMLSMLYAEKKPSRARTPPSPWHLRIRGFSPISRKPMTTSATVSAPSNTHKIASRTAILLRIFRGGPPCTGSSLTPVSGPAESSKL
jgi:tetratricopeptide (TPR) repeat protein